VLKPPQAARLLAIDRDARGTRLLLLKRDEAGVGSAEGSALQVADANVADRHAIIRHARGRYYVVDLKSAAGTFVNGNRIRRKQELKHGDILRFGGAAPYRFIDPDALKRRRWRRSLRASAVVAVLIAVAAVDHFEKWNLFSLATLDQIARVNSPAAPRLAAPPVTKVASAPAPPPAQSAVATAMPGPAEYAANAAPVAVPSAAPKSLAPVSTSVKSSLPSMGWLQRINFYRQGLGLRPIRDDRDSSSAAAAHARYLLLNLREEIRGLKPMSPDAYQEKPGRSGYTARGANAAKTLQLAWGCSLYDAGRQIDRWIEGPFHRLTIFDPQLAQAGCGEAESDGCWVAALRLSPPPEDTRPYPRAIAFPPAGAAVAMDWLGLEAPDPLASCPGYARPVGLPITLQIGRDADAKVSAHSLTQDGKPIESCAFDAPSYRNSDPTAHEYGQLSLRDAGAVVIVPRAQLQPGSRYAVSIAANGKTYAWSFKVAESATTFIPIALFPTAAPIVIQTPAPITIATSAPIALAVVEPPRPITRLRKSTPAPPASPIALETPAIVAPPPPAAVSAPTTLSSGANWLATLNLYRALLKLPPLEEDPALSHGCRDHAKYLVTNYTKLILAGFNPGSLMHNEEESKLDYTPDGMRAARNSDVMFDPTRNLTDEQRMTGAIQRWMAGPFHRSSMVNPDLRQVGFGGYCGERLCAAALDWRDDLEPALPGGHPYPTPIEVPPDGATVRPSGYGGEWPSPTAPCIGYPNNAAAITIQLGINMEAALSDASLTQTTGAAAGTKVGTCAYDFRKYTNPDPGTQAHGREVLRGFAEVVMMVRDPLVGGESYRVNMTVNGKPYTWSFTVLK